MHILNILESIGALFFVVFFIGLCIFSHELGHFLAARWRKLHIDAFSIGFRKVWAKKINGVEYRIGCIPLGGYVELPQVDATDEIPKSADGTELQRAKPLDRIITAVAGPLFNVIFGLLLGCRRLTFARPFYPAESTFLTKVEEVFHSDDGLRQFAARVEWLTNDGPVPAAEAVLTVYQPKGKLPFSAPGR